MKNALIIETMLGLQRSLSHLTMDGNASNGNERLWLYLIKPVCAKLSPVLLFYLLVGSVCSGGVGV